MRPAEDFPIVALGGSIGALYALTELFKVLRKDTGMAFVVITHMSPYVESLLVELLIRVTRMPVATAWDGELVKANHVYVIAPNTILRIRKGCLKVSARVPYPEAHIPVDHFFESLAADRKERAIGIVLSGANADGTHGISAIKAAGGRTYAQTRKSAHAPQMPVSAASTGKVDFILTPHEIGLHLSALRWSDGPLIVK